MPTWARLSPFLECLRVSSNHFLSWIRKSQALCLPCHSGPTTIYRFPPRVAWNHCVTLSHRLCLPWVPLSTEIQSWVKNRDSLLPLSLVLYSKKQHVWRPAVCRARDSLGGYRDLKGADRAHHNLHGGICVFWMGQCESREKVYLVHSTVKYRQTGCSRSVQYHPSLPCHPICKSDFMWHRFSISSGDAWSDKILPARSFTVFPRLVESHYWREPF